MTDADRKTLEAAEKVLIELKHSFGDAAYEDKRPEFIPAHRAAIHAIVTLRVVLMMETV